MPNNYLTMRLFFLLFLSTLILPIFSQQYQFEHFHANNGFADTYVYTITQDANGYLWMGTSNGVYQYDGFRFTQFTTEDSLSSNFVTTSANYAETVWFGHRDGSLTKFKNHVFEKVVLNTESESSISAILSFENKLWIGDYSGNVYSISEGKDADHFIGANEVTINSMQFLSANRLLIGSDDGVRICQISDGEITVEKQLIAIPKTKIPSIIKVSDEEFVIATEDYGVYELNISKKSIYVEEVVGVDDIQGQLLSGIAIDSRSNLWLGTLGGGLFHVSVNSNSHSANVITNYSAYSSANIRFVYADRDENIWLGNYGSGLTKVLNNPFKKYSFGAAVNAFVADSAQKYYSIANKLYTSDYSIESDTSLKYILTLPVEEITSLELVGSNSLWIGTHRGGLYVFNRETGVVERFNLGGGSLQNNINVVISSDDFIWAGTQKGLAQINKQNKQLQWFTISGGQLAHNVINDIFIHNKNDVYVATQSNVVSVYSSGAWNRIVIPSDEGVININSLYKDDSDALWLASGGSGLFKVQGDSILNIRETEGLYSDYCYRVYSNSNKYLWLSHRNGLSRIDKEHLMVRAVSKFAKIEESDIFSSRAIAEDKNGVIWMGYSNGMLCYNPAMENVHSKPPLLNITSVTANELLLDLNADQKLPSDNYKLQINFIGVSLKEPNQVQYQYRLLGLDDEWSPITAESSVTYSGLGAGKYLFEVLASSAEGIDSVVKTYSFTIKKSLWVQWWFYLAIGVFLFVAFVLYIKRREYKLVEYNKQLEKGVKDRTKEIERQKDEIERQGEEIIKKNIDITDSIKYARTIQSAIFPPEEILDEALPNHFLINRPKDIVSGDFCWYTKCEDKYIITVTDCTGHGVPGAIMSMLGITLFNEVVNNLKVTKAGHILDLVRDKVISALNQHKKDNPSYDGMNAGLVVVNKAEQTLQYAGAFHNLIHISGGELFIVKAERSAIGYSPLGYPAYITHTLNYKEGDMFYMFSDGYQDQFGGERDRKFTTKRLLASIMSVYQKSMNEQKQELDQILDDWIGEAEQTDDIIVLGFRM